MYENFESDFGACNGAGMLPTTVIAAGATEYKVNGWYPNYGCSRYQLKAGDVVEWRYTCDLGHDIGGNYAVGG